MSSLAEDLRIAADPVVLARRLGVEPDPWQAGVLRSSEARICLLCSRQAGKSTVSAVAALHCALYEPGSLVLIAAPSQRQSVELFRTITRFYRVLGRPVAAEAENTMSLALENGSRIVTLPGDERTTRGYAAVRLLIIDEGARVPDDFYSSVRPMLAVSGGRLIALSTPFGQRGWFHAAATSERGWKVVRVPADQVPRITAAFLE
ncbi:MAG TPA: terminase family protein, partial [Jatrophihabitantaceae bacterium]